jgi:hypothetical protein
MSDNQRAAQQINGRERAIATLIKLCGTCAPRHLNRWAFLGKIEQVFL